ncbi:MAG: phosphatase PAP2 family protein, partial [Oscillospiraceae bacterium]|nr:phosphatase PAP2 family protein [Oscillospiraceae bacterium]
DQYLSPFSKVLSFIGKDGICLFAIALILMLFRDTRKIGICVFGAIGAGAILSNLWIKDMVARPRPFETFEDIRVWWEAFNITQYSEYSFPSGHCTAAMAFASGFGFAGERDRKYWTLLLPFSMCFARCYLLMHYPSDCIAGLVIGFAGALVAWIITSIIYKILEHWEEVSLFDFLLNWDLIDAIREREEREKPKKKVKKEAREEVEYEDEPAVVRRTPKVQEKTEDGRTIFRAGD